MSTDIRREAEELTKLVGSLSPEELARGNAINVENAANEHRLFLEHFRKGLCYVCGKPLSSFNKDTPCLHWLLKPKGFKKKDLSAVVQRFGFFQLQSFLRWVANQEGFAKNINDLPSSMASPKLFEVTIRYKHLEWSLACTETDYQGHLTSRFARHPHYHFQMRINQQPFIDYNDFHVPFSLEDLRTIQVIRASPDKFKQTFLFGEGMSDVLTDETAERILDSSVPAGSTEDGTFSIDTMIMASEGSTISVDDVYAAIQEAKAKGVTVARLAPKIPNADVRVVVGPGPGVVEPAPRKGRASGP